MAGREAPHRQQRLSGVPYSGNACRRDRTATHPQQTRPLMHTVSPRRALRQRLQLLFQDIHTARAALDGPDEEALHRLRIALRQLRSLLRILQGLPDAAALAPLQLQLGELARSSNSWRDREVRLQQLQCWAKQDDTRAFARWRQREAEQLAAGRRQLALQGQALEPLLQAVWQQCQLLLAAKDRRLRKVLRQALQRSRRRYRRQRARLRQQPQDAQQAHRTRLLAKRLRYQVEVCAGLVSKRWRQRAERAKAWQQRLGDSRDYQLLLQSLLQDRVPVPAALRRRLGLPRVAAAPGP